jgi:hypothetical protein
MMLYSRFLLISIMLPSISTPYNYPQQHTRSHSVPPHNITTYSILFQCLHRILYCGSFLSNALFQLFRTTEKNSLPSSFHVEFPNVRFLPSPKVYRGFTFLILLLSTFLSSAASSMLAMSTCCCHTCELFLINAIVYAMSLAVMMSKKVAPRLLRRALR